MWPRQQTTIPSSHMQNGSPLQKLLRNSRRFFIFGATQDSICMGVYNGALYLRFLHRPWAHASPTIVRSTISPKSPQHRDWVAPAKPMSVLSTLVILAASSYFTTYTALLCISRHLFPFDMHRLYKAFSLPSFAKAIFCSSVLVKAHGSCWALPYIHLCCNASLCFL
jgi:hypothetical protein